MPIATRIHILRRVGAPSFANLATIYQVPANAFHHPGTCLGIEKETHEQCIIYSSFDYATLAPCTCLPDRSILCRTICLPEPNNRPHVIAVCGCKLYDPCGLEARCVAGELLTWNDTLLTFARMVNERNSPRGEGSVQSNTQI